MKHSCQSQKHFEVEKLFKFVKYCISNVTKVIYLCNIWFWINMQTCKHMEKLVLNEKLSQVVLPLLNKNNNKVLCGTRIPSLHIFGLQSPDLATAFLCQSCHTSAARRRQALPPLDRCWNALLKDQPWHSLTLLPCKKKKKRELQPDSHFHNKLNADRNHHRKAHSERQTDGLVVTILHSHHKFGTAVKVKKKKSPAPFFFFPSSCAPPPPNVKQEMVWQGEENWQIK